MIYALGDMPGYGDESAPANVHVSPVYVERSYQDTHRGYDTFGETTVIFTAGLVCLLLLGGWKSDGR
jgi:multicomponent Na+:H+ antiporter subunit B